MQTIGSEDTIFKLDDQLASINHGANRMDVTQIYPISGNVTNSLVGQGNAKQTIFTFSENANWWCPDQSYFNLQLQFVKYNSSTPSAPVTIASTDLVTYCDNFVCTLFSQIQTLIGSQPLDTITVPSTIDQVLTYSNSHKNFLDTWGSNSRIGEALSTRIANVTGNNGYVDVNFRPPVSILDCKCLPPGPQIQFTFTFAPSAILAFESLAGPITVGTTSGNYNIFVNSFSFYKASVNASPYVSLPQRGVIELFPSQINQYPISNSGTLKTNISLPGTTNRVYVVFQDTNQVTAAGSGASATVPPASSGVGNGYNPYTSFSTQFTTDSAGVTLSYLNQFWLDFPEIGMTAPKPIYSFDANGVDLLRAYEDWCNISQGVTSYQGSVPFGQRNQTPISITYIVATGGPPATTFAGALVQAGNRNNPQEYYINDTGVTLPTGLVKYSYSQTSRFGWLGRLPIFAFELVRPDDKKVSVGTLNAVFSGVPANVTASVISCYSMALAVEKQPNGTYNYMLVQGV
jgi:hypothetical protein